MNRHHDSPPEQPPTSADIAGKTIELLRARSATASICPSDVARAFSDDASTWRALMSSVRHVTADMARDNRIVITQGDRSVDPADVDHGAIRLRRGPSFPER